jgi:hypothetical protein
MAPPRTGAKPTTVRILPRLMSDLDNWIEAQPGPRLGRPEAIRRLLTERLAGQPAQAPPPSGATEGDSDLAELRRKFIMIAGKVDHVLAYAKRVEAERDALAARSSPRRSGPESSRRRCTSPPLPAP